MVRSENIAGVVVLYNPDDSIRENIQRYVQDLHCLYIFDNSEHDHEDLVREIGGIVRVHYEHFPDNVGMAQALNTTARNAIRDGYEYLLTMDQDSWLSDGVVREYRRYLTANDAGNIGMLTLFHRIEKYDKKAPSAPVEMVNTAFTSGSLLNLNAYQAVGPFNELFFIDYVDHEYCLRLRKRKYAVVRLNTVYCRHTLGRLDVRRFGTITMPVTHHSPVRLYYRTRNRLYVIAQYFRTFPLWTLIDIVRFFYESMLTVLFESDKKQKCRMILKGILDFARGRHGKYRD